MLRLASAQGTDHTAFRHLKESACAALRSWFSGRVSSFSQAVRTRMERRVGSGRPIRRGWQVRRWNFRQLVGWNRQRRCRRSREAREAVEQRAGGTGGGEQDGGGASGSGGGRRRGASGGGGAGGAGSDGGGTGGTGGEPPWPQCHAGDTMPPNPTLRVDPAATGYTTTITNNGYVAMLIGTGSN